MLVPKEADGVLVNGAPLSAPIELDDILTFQYKGKLFYLIGSQEMLERAQAIDISKWLVFFAETGKIEDEVAFPRIKNSVYKRGLNGVGLAICPKNFEYGFLFSQVFGDGIADENAALVAPNLSESTVAATCPLCWLKFDVGDALSIAVHESLRGDPVLGPDEMLRFLPTVFNNDGTPEGIDPEHVIAKMEGCAHVVNVHHLHIWAMSTTANALTAHVVIDDLGAMEQAKAGIKAALMAEGIAHSTLEMETADCHCADHDTQYGG